MCKFCGRSDRSYLDCDALQSSLTEERNNAARGLLCAVALEKREGPVPYEGYDPGKTYAFLNGPVQNIHENLLEQAKLNNKYGLFQVSGAELKEPGADGKYPVQKGDVFQIRGYDLANMTIVYDGTGWIVMDVLTTVERAEAVWKDIVQKFLEKDGDPEKQSIHTVVYSHSHIDHYGGIGGLEKFFSKGCVILAPDGFTKHAVSENIYVGTAMKRRASYQYGSNLPISEEGCVDCGLGKAVSIGSDSLIVPSREIGFTDYVNGRKYCVYDATDRKVLTEDPGTAPGHLILQMQYTPGTEAPAEMNVYLPEQKILFIAENCAGTLHNTLTPRGAEVRDPLAWAGFLDETLVTFSNLEIVCSAHNWPHFRHEDSVRFIEIQRDMYRYVNNATLRLVNLGYTIDEVGRMISGEDGTLPLPKEFIGEWCCHGFYGTYNHDAKAVYQRYMGWYDGNPAHLNRHKPQDRADRYVKAFGAAAILKAAETALGLAGPEKEKTEPDYEWAAELLDHLLNAKIDEETLTQAKTDYAKALTQLGYQSESPSWRNMYLTGAFEVSHQGQPGGKKDGDVQYLEFADDTVKAMTLEMILQYMGIMLDSKAVDKARYERRIRITINGTGGFEYAAAYVYRGILGYRITSGFPSEQDFPQDFSAEEIRIAGPKIDVFRAFVEHDMDSYGNLDVSDNAAGLMEYLTRFPLGFPIMTPRGILK